MRRARLHKMSEEHSYGFSLETHFFEIQVNMIILKLTITVYQKMSQKKLKTKSHTGRRLFKNIKSYLT